MKKLSQGKTLKACSWDRDYHCDGTLNLVTIPSFYENRELEEKQWNAVSH